LYRLQLETRSGLDLEGSPQGFAELNAMAKTETTTIIGKMLRTFRAINNFDLRYLADSIGISASTLMRIEHGRSTDMETWIKVWKFLMRETSAR
jgi:DNA-binding XRE family transcriptional regulator